MLLSEHVFHDVVGGVTSTIGILMSKQDVCLVYSKTTSPIFMKIGGKVYHGQTKNAINSGVDLTQGVA